MMLVLKLLHFMKRLSDCVFNSRLYEMKCEVDVHSAVLYRPCPIFKEILIDIHEQFLFTFLLMCNTSTVLYGNK